MAESTSDRTLPASPRRLQKAREEGQVARSRDLSHFAAVGGGIALLATMAPTLSQILLDHLQNWLRFDRRALESAQAMSDRLSDGTALLLMLAVPAGLAFIAVGILSALAAGGWVWTFKPMMPQFSRLDPLTGIGRLFAKKQLTDTLKSCALALVIGTVGTLYLRSNFDAFGGVIGLPLPVAISHLSQALLSGMIMMTIVLALTAAIDLPLQRFMHARELRMSHYEMKQEQREQDGNPEMKAHRRARQREMTNRRMLAAVPRADLVVMNPTHYAVALRYDDATMAAPRVVAKGADLLALRIRDVARDSKVPVLQAPPLARALYAHAEIDREIPAALFTAVAQVLAWVYQLRAAAAGRAAMPNDPAIEVPDGLDPGQNARSTDDLDDDASAAGDGA